MDAFENTYFSGQKLYGDDFTPEQIARWFEEESSGYFDLMGKPAAGYAYEYAALNEFHAFRHIRRSRYGTCVALGCATGDDVAPLADVVMNFVAVEPAREWWKDRIGGRPARYIAPAPSGALDLQDRSADLAISLGVLHHIPNVSAVIGEVARTLKAGGIFVIREPISSMGDWRNPRRGLTKNERGLPLPWLRSSLGDAGFGIEREHLCMLPPLSILASKLGVDRPYGKPAFVLADFVASSLLAANVHYRRDTLLKKIAPGSIFLIARKR